MIFIYRDVTKILRIENLKLLSNSPSSIIIIQFSLCLTDLKRPEISLEGKVIIRIAIVSFAVVLIISLLIPFDSAKYGPLDPRANWLA